MARPLRIQIPGGRYHLTARGNERRHLFRDERDREHFLELLGELPERFRVLLHAYVLMRNQFSHAPGEPGGEPQRDRSVVEPEGMRGNNPGCALGPGVGWERIVRAVESIKGEEWESFRNRREDWGRHVGLWLGRREARLTLAELGGVGRSWAGDWTTRRRARR